VASVVTRANCGQAGPFVEVASLIVAYDGCVFALVTGLSIGVWLVLIRSMIVRPASFLPRPVYRKAIAAAFGCCAAGMASVVLFRNTPDAYLVGLAGTQWLATCVTLFPFLGISVRDDVIERNNQAAAYALSGAMAGVVGCFTGASLNGGADLNAILISAASATLALFGLWILADKAGADWVDGITIDRETGAGIRLGGLLAALGLGLGSAASSGNLRNLLTGSWTVVPALCVAIVVERSLRSTREGTRSDLLAGSYVGLTIVVVALERHIR
jgi:uncharacterized membrane protein YjfL (UPF0719 family)